MNQTEFNRNIDKLSELYEEAKDKIIEANVTDPRLREILTEMRDLCGISLQSALNNK